jgi:hypothetical protein
MHSNNIRWCCRLGHSLGEGNPLAILAVERCAGERCDRIAIKVYSAARNDQPCKAHATGPTATASDTGRDHVEDSLSRHSTGLGDNSLVRLQLERRTGERCDPIITIEVSEVKGTARQHQACHESRNCVWWQSHLQGRERTHPIFPKNCAPLNDVIALSFRYR